MERLPRNSSISKASFAQSSVFLVQLASFLIMDWQYVQRGLRLPISDAVIWSVLFPVTWLIYGLIASHYFNHRLKAIFQGFIQTIVSYTIIAAITLFFHQWLGGSF